MIWPTNRKKLFTFGGDPVPDTDSGSFLHYSTLTTAEYGIV